MTAEPDYLLPVPKGSLWYYQLGRLTELVLRDTRLSPVAKILVLVIAYFACRDKTNREVALNWTDLEQWVGVARGTMYWGSAYREQNKRISPIHQGEESGYFRRSIGHGYTHMRFELIVDNPVDKRRGHDAMHRGLDAGDQGLDAMHQGLDAGDQGLDAMHQGLDAMHRGHGEATNYQKVGPIASKILQTNGKARGMDGRGTSEEETGQREEERRKIRKDQDQDQIMISEDRRRSYDLTASQLRVWRLQWGKAKISPQKTEMVIKSAERLASMGLLKPNEAVALLISVNKQHPKEEWALRMMEELAKISGFQSNEG